MTQRTNIEISTAAAQIIGGLLAILITIVAYVYVQDKVEQKRYDEKLEQRLDVIDLHLDVMTDCLKIDDPNIEQKIFKKLYERKGASYRGINQNTLPVWQESFRIREGTLAANGCLAELE